jgi:ribonuclease HI
MSSQSLNSGEIVAYCDGGSRGNPGPAGFGVYIQDAAGVMLAELSQYLGTRTNNFAEYSALLAALEFAIAKGHKSLRVVSDSELMVKQIKGQYRVNSPELRPLYEEAKRRIPQLGQFQIQHVLREKNRHADRLANLAMDRGTGSGAGAGATAASAEQGGDAARPGEGRCCARPGRRIAGRHFRESDPRVRIRISPARPRAPVWGALGSEPCEASEKLVW